MLVSCNFFRSCLSPVAAYQSGCASLSKVADLALKTLKDCYTNSPLLRFIGSSTFHRCGTYFCWGLKAGAYLGLSFGIPFYGFPIFFNLHTLEFPSTMESLRSAYRLVAFICKSAAVGAAVLSGIKASSNFIFSLLQARVVLEARKLWKIEWEEAVKIQDQILPYFHQDLPLLDHNMIFRSSDPLYRNPEVLISDIPNLSSSEREALFEKTALLTYPDMPVSQQCQRLYLAYFIQKDQPALWELAKQFFPNQQDPRVTDAALFKGYIAEQMFLHETPEKWQEAIEMVSQIEGFQDVCAWNRFLITKTAMGYRNEPLEDVLSACQTLIQRGTTLLEKECERVFLDAFPDHSSPEIADDESRLPFDSECWLNYIRPPGSEPIPRDQFHRIDEFYKPSIERRF